MLTIVSSWPHRRTRACSRSRKATDRSPKARAGREHQAHRRIRGGRGNHGRADPQLLPEQQHALSGTKTALQRPPAGGAGCPPAEPFGTRRVGGEDVALCGYDPHSVPSSVRGGGGAHPGCPGAPERSPGVSKRLGHGA